MAEVLTAARVRLFVALLLTAATLALFIQFERYQVVRPQILDNGDFSAGLKGWRTTDGSNGQLLLEDGLLVIRANEPGQFPSVRQTIAKAPDVTHVRLSAWVRHSGVTKGLRPWQAMRLLLAQKGSDGRSQWELPHVVEQSRGDGPWRHVGRLFWLPRHVKTIEVIAVLNRVAGQMQVRDLKLEVMREAVAFKWSRYALTALWIGVFPWLIWPFCRPGVLWGQRILVVFLAMTVLAGALTPHTAKDQLRRALQAILNSEPAISAQSPIADTKPAQHTNTASEQNIPIGELWRGAHKLGHVLLFALLALAVCLHWRQQHWYRLALYLGAFAVTVETLQLLSLDRTSHPYDAGLNLIGVAVGLAFGSYFNHRRSNARSNSSNTGSFLS